MVTIRDMDIKRSESTNSLTQSFVFKYLTKMSKVKLRDIYA